MSSRMESNGHLPSGEVTSATAYHAVAQWLVTTEMGAAEGAPAGSAAASRVFDKLSQRLAQLITPVGSEALLTRAVHLSRAEFPFLDDVQSAPDTASLIARLRATAANVEPSQAHQGFVNVLATLVALLVSFIGQDLTFRLLRDVWPELPMTPHSPPHAERRNGNLEATP